MHKLQICFKLSLSFAPSLLQVVTNQKNTVQGFKRFHGRAFSDPYVQSVKSTLVYDLAPMPSGSTGIKVRLDTSFWKYVNDCASLGALLTHSLIGSVREKKI